ncbi:hypothetical protein GCM10018954_049510 [Kutzneria kofuensis]
MQGGEQPAHAAGAAAPAAAEATAGSEAAGALRGRVRGGAADELGDAVAAAHGDHDRDPTTAVVLPADQRLGCVGCVGAAPQTGSVLSAGCWVSIVVLLRSGL